MAAQPGSLWPYGRVVSTLCLWWVFARFERVRVERADRFDISGERTMAVVSGLILTILVLVVWAARRRPSTTAEIGLAVVETLVAALLALSSVVSFRLAASVGGVADPDGLRLLGAVWLAASATQLWQLRSGDAAAAS